MQKTHTDIHASVHIHALQTDKQTDRHVTYARVYLYDQTNRFLYAGLAACMHAFNNVAEAALVKLSP